MSILFDDEQIALAQKMLEIAFDIAPEVYGSVMKIIKEEHPKLLPADLPGDESGEMKKTADAMLDKKFGKKP